MKLCFTLSMRRRASWNGGWSGEGKLYAKVVNFTNTQKSTKRANRILAGAPYCHRWGDGWMAQIEVRIVDPKEAIRIKRESQGFCGYDWMIENIIAYGATEKPEMEAV